MNSMLHLLCLYREKRKVGLLLSIFVAGIRPITQVRFGSRSLLTLVVPPLGVERPSSSHVLFELEELGHLI